MARTRCAQKRNALLSNIVLMGMGEPLYNFDNVRDAMKIAMDPEGISCPVVASPYPHLVLCRKLQKPRRKSDANLPFLSRHNG